MANIISDAVGIPCLQAGEDVKLRGIKPLSTARDLVAKARTRSKMTEDQALQLAVEEVRAQRKN